MHVVAAQVEKLTKERNFAGLVYSDKQRTPLKSRRIGALQELPIGVPFWTKEGTLHRN